MPSESMPLNIPEDSWKTVGLFIYEVTLQVAQDQTSKLWYMRETSELYGTFVNDELPYQTEEEVSEFALECIRTGQLSHM